MSKSAGHLEQEIDAALAECKTCAQGLFLIMRRVMVHPENKRPGFLQQHGKPMNVESLAVKAKLSAEVVSKLLKQLKVASTRDPALALIDEDDAGRLWSPALQKWHERLSGERERKKAERARKSQEKEVKSDGVTSRSKGVTSAECPLENADNGRTGFTPSHSPPSLSPETPLTTTPSLSPASKISGEAAPSPGQRKAKSAGKGQPGEWKALTDFWVEQHRQAEGVTVEFQSVDGSALAALWGRVGYDLERAKAVILAYLRDNSPFYEGHPLTKLRGDLHKFITRASKGTNGHAHAQSRRTPAAARGISEDLQL